MQPKLQQEEPSSVVQWGMAMATSAFTAVGKGFAFVNERLHDDRVASIHLRDYEKLKATTPPQESVQTPDLISGATKVGFTESTEHPDSKLEQDTQNQTPEPAGERTNDEHGLTPSLLLQQFHAYMSKSTHSRKAHTNTPAMQRVAETVTEDNATCSMGHGDTDAVKKATGEAKQLLDNFENFLVLGTCNLDQPQDTTLKFDVKSGSNPLWEEIALHSEWAASSMEGSFTRDDDTAGPRDNRESVRAASAICETARGVGEESASWAEDESARIVPKSNSITVVENVRVVEDELGRKAIVQVSRHQRSISLHSRRGSYMDERNLQAEELERKKAEGQCQAVDFDKSPLLKEIESLSCYQRKGSPVKMPVLDKDENEPTNITRDVVNESHILELLEQPEYFSCFPVATQGSHQNDVQSNPQQEEAGKPFQFWDRIASPQQEEAGEAFSFWDNIASPQQEERDEHFSFWNHITSMTQSLQKLEESVTDSIGKFQSSAISHCHKDTRCDEEDGDDMQTFDQIKEYFSTFVDSHGKDSILARVQQAWEMDFSEYSKGAGDTEDSYEEQFLGVNNTKGFFPHLSVDLLGLGKVEKSDSDSIDSRYETSRDEEILRTSKRLSHTNNSPRTSVDSSMRERSKSRRRGSSSPQKRRNVPPETISKGISKPKHQRKGRDRSRSKCSDAEWSIVQSVSLESHIKITCCFR